MPPKRKKDNERDRSPAGRATGVVHAVLPSVWVVVRGEDYEGYSKIGVFSSRQEAVLCAKDSMCVGEWKEEETDTRWEDGCFYIEIHEETLWTSYADMRHYIDDELQAARGRRESDRLAGLAAGD